MWLVKFKKLSQDVSQNPGINQDAVFYYVIKVASILPTLLWNSVLKAIK